MKPMRIKAPRPIVTTVTVQDGFPAAIMDDLVYTMDDSRVLMGAPAIPAFAQPFVQPHLRPRVR